MHPTDDLTARGGLMVARAAARREAELRPLADAMQRFVMAWAGSKIEAHIRELSASDAALARAIDAAPGRG